MESTFATLATILTSRELGYLADRERAAILELVMTTVVPRGRTRLSPSLRLALRHELLQLPWAWEPSESTVDGLVDRSHLRLVPAISAKRLEALGATLAKAGIRPRRRESLGRVALVLALFDGGTETDILKLDPVRLALRVGTERMRQLAQEAHESTSVTRSSRRFRPASGGPPGRAPGRC